MGVDQVKYYIGVVYFKNKKVIMRLIYELREVNGEQQYILVEWNSETEPPPLYLDINDTKHIDLLKSLMKM